MPDSFSVSAGVGAGEGVAEDFEGAEEAEEAEEAEGAVGVGCVARCSGGMKSELRLPHEEREAATRTTTARKRNRERMIVIWQN
ncbi:MAG: hypothetical protein LBL72_04085, partial [Candidatus Accumulibacter sp.]|nr:hypothetical protein [Accumulibacter sp.]